jgi:branched-chain amino acid transport system substrate-binding protein
MTRVRHVLALAAAAFALSSASGFAADSIKIGFPIPLSGPAALYGVPILKGAEMAVNDINAKGGVLGRKLEILSRDSKASPDEAVRLARELIIKNNADFLIGTLTSAEAPAVSTIAKENKIVFIAPSAKTSALTAPANLHPYIFRFASNTTTEGEAGAIIISKWKGIKRIATIAPDYAYGRDAIASFVAEIKKLRPDIEIVDQQWPKLGEPDFTAFINAQMSKRPDAVFCDEYGGDFVTFVKQATPLGYFKAIHNRLADGGEVGAVDVTEPLGATYPFGIWSDAYDPVIWPGKEPPAHKAFVAEMKKALNSKYGSGWAIQGYSAVLALVAGIEKAQSTNSEKVSKALVGLTFDTPGGKRSFNANHDADTGEFWGEMVKGPNGFAIIKNPTYYNPEPVMN